MTLKSVAAALFVLVALITSPGFAAPPSGDQGIAAIVNDEVISVRDVQSRLDLVIATSNLEKTPEVRQKITPEVLRLLVDERLKRQEAARQNITVSSNDMNQAMTDIGRQLNIPADQIPGYLQSRGASMPALLSQLESEIAWIKTISRIANERTTISDEEVEEEVKRLQLTAGGTEYHIAEIFLAIDDPANEGQVAELANRIVQETRSGASFAQLARTFSQSTSSDAGGDIGWIRAAQLGPHLEASIQGMQNGQITGPIRTETGIYILQVLDRRTTGEMPLGPTAVRLSQLALPLPPGATPAQVDDQLRKARSLRGEVTDCDAFAARGRELGSSLSGDLGRIELDKLPAQIRQIITPLAVGQVSDPVRTGDAVIVLMVCERENAQVSQEMRTAVRNRLFEQRMSAISRQTLRDLRRSALLDIRM